MKSLRDQRRSCLGATIRSCKQIGIGQKATFGGSLVQQPLQAPHYLCQAIGNIIFNLP
jgi:hypothetical protein